MLLCRYIILMGGSCIRWGIRSEGDLEEVAGEGWGGDDPHALLGLLFCLFLSLVRSHSTKSNRFSRLPLAIKALPKDDHSLPPQYPSLPQVQVHH